MDRRTSSGSHAVKSWASKFRVPAQQLVDLLSRVAGDILSDHEKSNRCIEVAVVVVAFDLLALHAQDLRPQLWIVWTLCLSNPASKAWSSGAPGRTGRESGSG